MRFRGHTALTDVTTTIQADTITGLLGRNGAGKTTMMQLLTGHRVPTSGRVRVMGGAPYENDAVLSRICFIKESQRYPDFFKVKHALRAAELLYPHWDGGFAADLMADFALPVDRGIRKLSRGMLSAVGLDYQAVLDAGEVENVVSEWVLATELEASQPSRAQRGPQATLGVCHHDAQAARLSERHDLQNSTFAGTLTLPLLRNGPLPLPPKSGRGARCGQVTV